GDYVSTTCLPCYIQLSRFLSLPLLFYSSLLPPPLHSFPTRRSSDLIRSTFAQTIDNARFCGILIPLILSFLLYYHLQSCLSIEIDRKSTRLNSSHVSISYAVFCLKKKHQNLHSCVS